MHTGPTGRADNPSIPHLVCVSHTAGRAHRPMADRAEQCIFKKCLTFCWCGPENGWRHPPPMTRKEPFPLALPLPPPMGLTCIQYKLET
eukprot:1147123-Pelagomonas_calceolata.AAC.3